MDQLQITEIKKLIDELNNIKTKTKYYFNDIEITKTQYYDGIKENEKNYNIDNLFNIKIDDILKIGSVTA